MLHIALHARPGLWLFHDHLEARALWERCVALGPVHHLCLMPDHLHLFSRQVDPAKLRGAMSGFSRWVGHRRGVAGLRLWRGYAEPQPITNPEHLQRTRRYVLLNPCRGNLVGDPLAWPWSTHRDAVGLAWPRARRVVGDPVDFHGYVSRDRSVDTAGTDMPGGLYIAVPSYDQVEAAVSAVTRTPILELRRKPVHRRRLIACLRCLTDLSVRAIARRLGVSPGIVGAVPGRWDELARTVERVLGDERFAGVHSGDLRLTVMWERYEVYLRAKRYTRRRDLCG